MAIAEVYDRGVIERCRFGCSACGAIWTPPLRRLPAWIEGDARWDVCSEAPVGTWSLRPEPHGRPGYAVALNIEDVRGLVLHEDGRRTIGCCGIGYRERLPNLRCAACRREAAFRRSDGDHCHHAIFVPDVRVATALCDEPDDEALLARFSRRRAEVAPLPDAGMDGLPARLRVAIDRLWDSDVQKPALFPELADLSVIVCGLEVRLVLDGVQVRPPWPDGERERLIALGALPRGKPDDPLYWWSDRTSDKAERPDRHQWWQWCVDDELCVAWQRSPGGTSSESEAVAFRLPWELWELALREALAL